jgi:hypothetical protein
MTAFSKHNPNLQIAWDASSLKSFQFCPRHYQYANLEGWQNGSVDLAFGRLIASGLERFQKARLVGQSIEDALVAVVRWAMEETYTQGRIPTRIDDGEDPSTVDPGDELNSPKPGTQWGGRYETMWKCDGSMPYKNSKGNRAKCPFAFEKAWFPGDPPDICTECRGGIVVERRYVPDDARKNRQSLIQALVWYGLEQPEDLADSYHPYVFPDGTMAVELSGRLPLPFKNHYGEDYILTWNFDYIGQFGSMLFITDNKTTTKTLNSKYFDQYSPDTQFDTYAMVGTLAFPDLNIRGTMVDAVQIMVGGIAFGRHPFYKVEEQHEEHLHDLEVWIQLAEQYAIHGYWPMNKRNCWLCPFKQACSQPPAMRDRYLASNFQKQDRWNPLHER